MTTRIRDHRDVFIDEHAHEGERTYATFNHLIGLLSLFDNIFFGPIGAAIMWRIKKNESPFLDDHGREAVNFQLSLLLYFFGLSVVLGVVTFGLALPLIMIGVAALRLIGCIRGAMAAHRGEYYRYPMCIRFFG